MSRYKETLDIVGGIRTGMIGNVEKPTLYLLPILAEIALSLAVIADEMKPERKEQNHDRNLQEL